MNANTPNNNFLSPTSVIKKDHRSTKLLLDVNEFGLFSHINVNEETKVNNGLITPPSSLEEKSNYLENYNKSKMNMNNEKLTPPTTNNNMLAPPPTNNGMLAPPSTNTSIVEGDSTDTIKAIKAKKHSSFLNPLMDMSFEVGGLFGDGDITSDDLFGEMLSKYDNMTTEEISSKPTEEITSKPIEEIKKENRLSQDTIKMKHSSTIKGSGTIKGNTSNLSIQDKHTSQDTIKLLHNDSMKKVDSFDNQLVKNLNSKPSIVIDKTFLNSVEEEESKGFDPEIYKEDDKIDFSSTKDWENPWKSDSESDHKAESMKSSQSKLSAFSNFTLKSSKKLGKMTKKFYKKLLKQKEAPQFPKSPLDIPSSYNEKERAFEEMILRDDTISLSLSNPNGTLTSTFADKTFPLPEVNSTENNVGNNTETENEVENNFANNSFISSVSCEEELANKKKRHRNGINFEEALKEGNNFRVSLANMD
jgi:hypothetical protein